MIEMTKKEILNVAIIAERFGSEVIETYLYGDRSKGERVWIWNRQEEEWKDLYIYPWVLNHPAWGEFYIGADPNEKT